MLRSDEELHHVDLALDDDDAIPVTDVAIADSQPSSRSSSPPAGSRESGVPKKRTCGQATYVTIVFFATTVLVCGAILVGCAIYGVFTLVSSNLSPRYYLSETHRTHYGYESLLEFEGDPEKEITHETQTPFGSLILRVHFFEKSVRIQLFPWEDHSEIEYSDPVERLDDGIIDRWEVPIGHQMDWGESVANQLPDERFDGTGVITGSGVSYRIVLRAQPFGLVLERKAEGGSGTGDDDLYERIVNIGSLMFSDQYLRVAFEDLHGRAFYGFDTLGFRLNRVAGSCSHLWNKDEYCKYNSHPFLLQVRNNPGQQDHGKMSGIMFLTSNLPQWCFVESTWARFVQIGGVFDMTVFMDEDPVAQFHQLLKTAVSDPWIPPRWALGYHQSKWGYSNVQALDDVVQHYRSLLFPIDVIWSDIDYMDEYRDFTLDPTNFPEPVLKNFTRKLHDDLAMRYVVIVDPGISNSDPQYEPYKSGLEQGIFVREATLPNPFIGQVWPGSTVFPDFSHPDILNYWRPLVGDFATNLGIDGIWIDMNEVANFCDGHCSQSWVPSSTLDLPPVLPSSVSRIYEKTISMEARHWDGETHYNLHNLYGYDESVATRRALEMTTGKRAFVLSRSTFLGSGNHVANWLGDNWGTWEDLRATLRGIFSQNLAGVTMTGGDICGFNGGATAELCARYYQVAAFFPFARAHAAIDALPQEPYMFSLSITNVTRNAIRMRYSLLPFFYTEMVKVMTLGGMLWRPLVHVWPELQFYDEMFEQFVIANHLFVSPALYNHQTQVEAFIPYAVRMYRLFGDDRGTQAIGTGSILSFDAPIDTIVVHQLAGTIVPMQEVGLTTKLQENLPYSLTIALDPAVVGFDAQGDLRLDDGENLDTAIYTHFTFSFIEHRLFGTLDFAAYNTDLKVLQKVTLFGTSAYSSPNVLVNGLSHSSVAALSNDAYEVYDLNLWLNETFQIEFPNLV